MENFFNELTKKIVSLPKEEKLDILIHNNPDADAIAAAFAFQFLLKDYYKRESRIIYGGSESMGIATRKFFYSQKVQIIMERNIGNDFNHFICIDTNGLGNIPTRFNKNIIVAIDHHTPKTLDGVLLYNEQVGSCCTIIYKMFEYLNIIEKLKNNKEIATALLFGILMDTNNFSELHRKSNEDQKIFIKIANYGDESDARFYFRNQMSIKDIESFYEVSKNLQKIRDQLYICYLEENFTNDAMVAIIPEFLLNFVEIDFICCYWNSSKELNKIDFIIRNERKEIDVAHFVDKLKEEFKENHLSGGGRANLGRGRCKNISNEKFVEKFSNVLIDMAYT